MADLDLKTATGAADSKATPADADRINLFESAGWTFKALTWANLKATLKTATDLLYAGKGANSDITSLSGLTTPLTVPQGGQGAATLADGGIVIGNGDGAVEVVAAGATTEILVGGGAATKPVFTTATGTGAPVRATSPSLVTPALGTPASGVATNITGLPTAGLVDKAVVYAKIQDISDTDKILGRSTAGAGVTEEIACTAAGRALLDDANAAAQLVTLGAAKVGANSDITSLTGLTSAGALPALAPVTDSAANFAANFATTNLYGGTFVCNDAGTCQLPEMAAGMNFTIITLGAIEVVVDTNANDGYLMDGTTNAEGKNLTNLSTAGDIAVFQYYTADDWLITTNGWTPEA